MHNESVTIRQATAHDIKAIIDLGAMLQNESRAYEPQLVFDRLDSLEHYKNELNNPNAYIIVAEKQGEVIGYQYSFMTQLDYLAEANKECVLEAIYIQPNERSHGVAKMLIAASETWAVDRMSADRIKATIYVGNVISEQLHLRNGFRPHATEYVKDL